MQTHPNQETPQKSEPGGSRWGKSQRRNRLYKDHGSVRLLSGRRYDCGPVFDLFMDYSEDLFNAIPEARGEDIARARG